MKTIPPMKLAARLGIYCLGLLILAFGIALAVNSKLGVSPVSSLPYVVSLILNVSLGTCTTVIYALYILLQMVLTRKFQPVLLLQLVFSTIFGYFVDGAKYVLGDFCLPTYFGQLAMLAAVRSLVFLGKLTGIREGTVLTALLVGKMMGILRKFAGPWIQKLCF